MALIGRRVKPRDRCILQITTPISQPAKRLTMNANYTQIIVFSKCLCAVQVICFVQ